MDLFGMAVMSSIDLTFLLGLNCSNLSDKDVHTIHNIILFVM